MATKQNVSFQDPATYFAPDLVVERQQVERRQALIDVLREQGLQPIDGGRGAISWTQGLAKLLGTWAAGSMQKKNDTRSVDINRRYADQMGARFGLPPRASAAPAFNPAPMPMQRQAAPQGLPPIQLGPNAAALNLPNAPAAMDALNGAPPPSAPPQSVPMPMPASVPAQAARRRLPLLSQRRGNRAMQ